MVVEHLINAKKCPHCGKVLKPQICEGGELRHVEYVCKECNYTESDDKSIDIDTRYAPTFNVLPIIKI